MQSPERLHLRAGQREPRDFEVLPANGLEPLARGSVMTDARRNRRTRRGNLFENRHGHSSLSRTASGVIHGRASAVPWPRWQIFAVWKSLERQDRTDSGPDRRLFGGDSSEITERGAER